MPSSRCAETLLPEKGGIFVDDIGRRRIPELTIHSDLFKLVKECVRLSRVHGIAKLSINEQHQNSFS